MTPLYKITDKLADWYEWFEERAFTVVLVAAAIAWAGMALIGMICLGVITR